MDKNSQNQPLWNVRLLKVRLVNISTPFDHGTWDIFWKFLVKDTFTILQKNVFDPIFFWISCKGSKVPFWQFFTFDKMALLYPCIKSKIFFGPKAFFWSIMKVSLIKNFQKMSQGSPNTWLRSAKVQKGDFLKKHLRELKNYFCFRFL